MPKEIDLQRSHSFVDDRSDIFGTDGLSPVGLEMPQSHFKLSKFNDDKKVGHLSDGRSGGWQPLHFGTQVDII